MTTQNVNALSPVGYLNTVTGHIWTPTEQPDAADQPGIYEPLVLSREALAVVQQKDALQLSVDNILRGLGITGDGSVTQLVLEKFIALQAERDALAAENVARKDLVEQHAGCFSVCPNCSHEEPSEADDVVWMSREMETPATDATIAEIKAQGVDMFAKLQDYMADQYRAASPGCYGEQLHSAAQASAIEFAANLRAGRKG